MDGKEKEKLLSEVYRKAFKLLSESEKDLLRNTVKTSKKEITEGYLLNRYKQNKATPFINACKKLGLDFEDLRILKADERKRQQKVPIVLVPILVAILRSGSKSG